MVVFSYSLERMENAYKDMKAFPDLFPALRKYVDFRFASSNTIPDSLLQRSNIDEPESRFSSNIVKSFLAHKIISVSSLSEKMMILQQLAAADYVFSQRDITTQSIVYDTLRSFLQSEGYDRHSLITALQWIHQFRGQWKEIPPDFQQDLKMALNPFMKVKSAESRVQFYQIFSAYLKIGMDDNFPRHISRQLEHLLMPLHQDLTPLEASFLGDQLSWLSGRRYVWSRLPKNVQEGSFRAIQTYCKSPELSRERYYRLLVG